MRVPYRMLLFPTPNRNFLSSTSPTLPFSSGTGAAIDSTSSKVVVVERTCGVDMTGSSGRRRLGGMKRRSIVVTRERDRKGI